MWNVKTYAVNSKLSYDHMPCFSTICLSKYVEPKTVSLFLRLFGLTPFVIDSSCHCAHKLLSHWEFIMHTHSIMIIVMNVVDKQIFHLYRRQISSPPNVVFL